MFDKLDSRRNELIDRYEELEGHGSDPRCKAEILAILQELEEINTQIQTECF